MTAKSAAPASLLDWSLLRPALLDSLRKLSPRAVARNPVMFVVEVGSVLVTLIWLRDLLRPAKGSMHQHDNTDRHAQFPLDIRPRISSWRQLM